MPDRLEPSAAVESFDPFRSCELDGFEVSPCSTVADTHGLVQTVVRSKLGETSVENINLESESVGANELKKFLNQNGVHVVDMLDRLREQPNRIDLYRSNDGHPNHKGYAVITKVVAEAISEL